MPRDSSTTGRTVLPIPARCGRDGIIVVVDDVVKAKIIALTTTSSGKAPAASFRKFRMLYAETNVLASMQR